MSADMIIDLLQAALRWGAPLILVSIGEVYAERTGVNQYGYRGHPCLLELSQGLQSVS